MGKQYDLMPHVTCLSSALDASLNDDDDDQDDDRIAHRKTTTRNDGDRDARVSSARVRTIHERREFSGW